MLLFRYFRIVDLNRAEQKVVRLSYLHQSYLPAGSEWKF